MGGQESNLCGQQLVNTDGLTRKSCAHTDTHTHTLNGQFIFFISFQPKTSSSYQTLFS